MTSACASRFRDRFCAQKDARPKPLIDAAFDGSARSLGGEGGEEVAEGLVLLVFDWPRAS